MSDETKHPILDAYEEKLPGGLIAFFVYGGIFFLGLACGTSTTVWAIIGASLWFALIALGYSNTLRGYFEAKLDFMKNGKFTQLKE